MVTDINMPVMTGLELLNKINEKQDNKIKVVIISAYSDMDNIRYAMNKGAFDFLTKPIDLKDLEKTIEKTVDTAKFIRQSFEIQAQMDTYNKELYTANEIQQAILPKVFPPFPELKQFDIYGHMKAAQFVGGDFFDFFLIGDDKLGFTIGDVSGKGVPAALFMAVARTVIQSVGGTGVSTKECISYANSFLCKESVDSMFVTIFYGILNFKTGELQYTNAGHNYPYIINPDNNVTMLDVGSNVILGAFENAVFTENITKLSPNSSIVLYTDGVNEAADINNRQLGTDAIVRYLAFGMDKKTPEQITQGIFNLVKQHAVECDQSDDITVLTLTFNGK